MIKPTRLAHGIAALGLALSVAACGTGATIGLAGAVSSVAQATSGATTAGSTLTGTAATLLADNVASHAQADDVDYDAADAADAVTVRLSDAGSTASGAGVTVSGSTVTITQKGTYVLSGSLSNGQVLVDSSAEGKVRLVLDGVSISNSSSAAIYVKAADEAVIVLKDGTSNTVSDAATYAAGTDTDAPNAAIYSMADLTIGGAGSLTVRGNGNDGVASKDGLVILGGSVTVTAKDDGLRGKDYLIVAGGTLQVTAGGDGLTSDNETDDTVGSVRLSDGTVTISAGDDGVHAEGDLAIEGGSLTVQKSTEGLEGANIVLAGGTSTVTATDDGVNASAGASSGSQAGQGGPGGGGGMANTGEQLLITGGTHVVSSGGDGLDSNGTISISGGTTVVNGPTTNGNGALDSNGGITVTGGTVLAAGSAGMAEAPGAASTTGWLQVSLPSAVQAGSTVQIVSGGTVVASYTAPRTAANIVLAGAGITKGQSYDVYVGGRLAAESVATTFSLGGSTTGAAKVATVTAGSATGNSMGGFGGRP